MLVEINLLAWRQLERHTAKKKCLWIIAIVLLFIIVMFFVIDSGIKTINNFRIGGNARLHNEIELLNAQINKVAQLKKDKNDLVIRINFIQQLTNNADLVMYFLNKLVTMIPRGIYLNSLKIKNKKIILFGVANSHEEITRLMNNINENDWIEKTKLLQIKKGKNTENKFFSFSFFLVEPRRNSMLMPIKNF